MYPYQTETNAAAADYVIAKTFFAHPEGDESRDGRKVQYITSYREYAGQITRVFFGNLWDAMIVSSDEAGRIESFLGVGCCDVLQVGVDVHP